MRHLNIFNVAHNFADNAPISMGERCRINNKDHVDFIIEPA